ncbi:hypothetical protein [Phenylobacterium conjunctum]|uniref:B30.2/SPRY domain-containing protein n=1 Tax=Phenylobacterium conjunctum TaxID=1298959 RepID=A0ABW3SZF8_9CAUL
MLMRNRMLLGGYRKPVLMTTGAGPGTITPNTAGYALSGFADTCFAWLDAPKTQGKWYWEVVKQGSHGLFGIADDVATSASYGGYSGANAGIYTTTPSLWADAGWTGASWGGGWSGAAVANGDVLGFALDVDSKTLRIYQNNTLAATLSWTSGPTTLWPLIAFQFGPAAQVNLGPSGCTYAPPAGYTHI